MRYKASLIHVLEMWSEFEKCFVTWGKDFFNLDQDKCMRYNKHIIRESLRTFSTISMEPEEVDIDSVSYKFIRTQFFIIKVA